MQSADAIVPPYERFGVLVAGTSRMSRRILIVEIEAALRKCGPSEREYFEAESVEDTVKKLAEHAFNLVIVDGSADRADALAMIDAVRAHRHLDHLKIVFVSEFAADELEAARRKNCVFTRARAAVDTTTKAAWAATQAPSGL